MLKVETKFYIMIGRPGWEGEIPVATIKLAVG